MSDYLLDVAPLVALLWHNHEHHTRARQWFDGSPRIAVCPITQLGFLRVSTQALYGSTIDEAWRVLFDWTKTRTPQFIPCDLDALEMADPPSGKLTTDFYLASLAQKHGMRLATLDGNIKHEAVLVIPG